MPSAALSHYLRRKKLLSQGGMSMVGGGLSTAFNAPLKASLVAVKGVLAAFTRDNSDATVTNFEGLIRNVLPDEARFVGARRVENVIPPINTDSFVEASGTVEGYTTDPEGGQTAIKLSSTTTMMIYLAIVDSRFVSGKEYVLSVWLKCNLPSQVVPLMSGGFSGTNVTVTDQWQRFSVIGTTAIGTAYVGIINALGAIEIDMWQPQYEEITGQENQNPSEFVSVGVSTEPEIINPLLLESDFLQVAGELLFDNNGAVSFITGSTIVYTSTVAYPARINGIYLLSAECTAYSAGTLILTYGGDTNNQMLFTGIGKQQVYIKASDIYGLDIATIDSGRGTIENISIKEIQHGSNVDGVKYFDTLNYNIVTDNIVSQIAPPTGADIQQIVDPAMDNDVLASSNGDADWIWELSSWEKSAGKLRSLILYNAVSSNITTEIDKYYRVKYTLVTTDASLIVSSGAGIGVLPDVSGTYDITYKATVATAAISLISLLNTDTTIDNVEVIPLYSIPDDIIKGVLIEEESINLIPDSEDISDASWGVINGIRDNSYAVSPNGMQTAGQLLDDSSTGSKALYISRNGVVVTTDGVCASCYVKADQLSWFAIQSIAFDASAEGISYFDVGTGVVGSKAANHISSGIEFIRDGWYRCWITFSTTTDLSGNIRYRVADGDLQTAVDMDGTSSLLLWGMMVEDLTYPTSYIPTAGNTADRLAESLIYETPEFMQATINNYTYTLEAYLAFDETSYSLPQSWQIQFYEDTNNKLGNYWSTVGSLTGFHKALGITTTQQDSIVITHPNSYKSCCVFDGDAGTFGYFINGTEQEVKDTGIAKPIFSIASKLSIGSTAATTAHANNPVKNIKVYKKALSDDKCIGLTS